MDIDDEKWKLMKNTVGILFGEMTMICAIWKILECYGAVLRAITKELGVEWPEEPPPVDEEAIRKIAAGLVELERMFNEDDERPPQ